MFTGMLHLHSTFRYLILIISVWAIIKMAKGMSGNKVFVKSDKTAALLYMIIMDIQLLVGLYLYFFGNLGIKLFQGNSMGDIMKNNYYRFFAIEHIFGMIVAIILVHIGYASTKKQIADKAKFKKAFWYFFIALLIILITIPWPFRTELARHWMP